MVLTSRSSQLGLGSERRRQPTGKVLKRHTGIGEEVVFIKEDLKRVKVAFVEFVFCEPFFPIPT